jgi:hypothetical protein
MHGFENVGQAGLRELLLQRGLRRSEDLLQRGLNAVPDRQALFGRFECDANGSSVSTA